MVAGRTGSQGVVIGAEEEIPRENPREKRCNLPVMRFIVGRIKPRADAPVPPPRPADASAPAATDLPMPLGGAVAAAGPAGRVVDG